MTKERPELSKERIENVIFRMRREGDIQAFETVMALHARVQELEAKAKVRLSIPPVQLPEPDINTANHAGVRVLGYTAHKVSELLAASAAHRARADDEKAKLQHYRTALEAIAAGNTDPDGMVALAASALSANCKADVPNVNQPIVIDGDDQRDITIHPPKVGHEGETK